MQFTTLAIVKDRLGITVNTFDGQISQIINAVSLAIERFCDRDFDLADYTEQGVILQNRLILKNRPINSIYACLVDDTNIIQVQYNGTKVFSLKVDSDKVITYENFSPTSYSYTTYPTVLDLQTVMNSNANCTCTLTSTVYQNWPSKLLYQGHSTVGDSTTLFIEMPTSQATLAKLHDGIYSTDKNGKYVCVYNGGFASAPADLQELATKLACTLYLNKAKDISVKSESIGDYSYTGIEMKEDVDAILMNTKSYTSVLDSYRIKVI